MLVVGGEMKTSRSDAVVESSRQMIWIDFVEVDGSLMFWRVYYSLSFSDRHQYEFVCLSSITHSSPEQGGGKEKNEGREK